MEMFHDFKEHLQVGPMNVSIFLSCSLISYIKVKFSSIKITLRILCYADLPVYYYKLLLHFEDAVLWDLPALINSFTNQNSLRWDSVHQLPD